MEKFKKCIFGTAIIFFGVIPFLFFVYYVVFLVESFDSTAEALGSYLGVVGSFLVANHMINYENKKSKKAREEEVELIIQALKAEIIAQIHILKMFSSVCVKTIKGELKKYNSKEFADCFSFFVIDSTIYRASANKIGMLPFAFNVVNFYSINNEIEKILKLLVYSNSSMEDKEVSYFLELVTDACEEALIVIASDYGKKKDKRIKKASSILISLIEQNNKILKK